MSYYLTNPNYSEIKIYVRMKKQIKIKAANPELIKYGFWKGRFCNAKIERKGHKKWLDIKEATFQKFGQGYQPNKNVEVYAWSGEKTKITL